VYENPQLGFSFVPPAGWSERARFESLPLGTGQERPLVQYKRLQAGNPAWLRLSLADLPKSIPLENYLIGRSPRSDWRREPEIESIEAAGQLALKVTFTGRWGRRDLVCETVAVAHDTHVYFFTGFFPATDSTGREAFHQAVRAAVWK
jgi:hypothetical protein